MPVTRPARGPGRHAPNPSHAQPGRGSTGSAPPPHPPPLPLPLRIPPSPTLPGRAGSGPPTQPPRDPAGLRVGRSSPAVDPAQLGPTRLSSARPGSARPDPARLGSIPVGTTRPGTTRPGSAGTGSPAQVRSGRGSGRSQPVCPVGPVGQVGPSGPVGRPIIGGVGSSRAGPVAVGSAGSELAVPRTRVPPSHPGAARTAPGCRPDPPPAPGCAPATDHRTTPRRGESPGVRAWTSGPPARVTHAPPGSVRSAFPVRCKGSAAVPPLVNAGLRVVHSPRKVAHVGQRPPTITLCSTRVQLGPHPGINPGTTRPACGPNGRAR
ncbi:hypothetical protein B0I31_105307 [Saccharothrix carnea]|uniref:Uncharacterized protein n=1 Tax=Saccharothrix carnea TaxID=1280637 RepID=A0A2P8IA53_SACCR|nr:hypothetical protein B0I31_105307 [Saccharothrix carnea]